MNIPALMPDSLLALWQAEGDHACHHSCSNAVTSEWMCLDEASASRRRLAASRQPSVLLGPGGSCRWSSSSWRHMKAGQRHFLCTHLVGDVVDSDVVHGGSVALEQSVKVRPTVPESSSKIFIRPQSFRNMK